MWLWGSLWCEFHQLPMSAMVLGPSVCSLKCMTMWTILTCLQTFGINVPTCPHLFWTVSGLLHTIITHVSLVELFLCCFVLTLLHTICTWVCSVPSVGRYAKPTHWSGDWKVESVHPNLKPSLWNSASHEIRFVFRTHFLNLLHIIVRFSHMFLKIIHHQASERVTCYVKIVWTQVLAWNIVPSNRTHGWNKDGVFLEVICVHKKAMNTNFNRKLNLCWLASFIISKLQKESKACCSVKIKSDRNDEVLICPAVESSCVCICLSVCLSGDLRTMYLPKHRQMNRQKEWQTYWQTDWQTVNNVFMSSLSCLLVLIMYITHIYVCLQAASAPYRQHWCVCVSVCVRACVCERARSEKALLKMCAFDQLRLDSNYLSASDTGR